MELPRAMRRNIRAGRAARQRYEENRAARREEKWRRIREGEKSDPLRPKGGSATRGTSASGHRGPNV